MNFGDRLRQMRYELGLNQLKMAERLHMEQSTYSRYENGKTKATSDMIVRIAEDFKVSTDWLLGKTDIKENISRPLPFLLEGKLTNKIPDLSSTQDQDWRPPSPIRLSPVPNQLLKQLSSQVTLKLAAQLSQSRERP